MTSGHSANGNAGENIDDLSAPQSVALSCACKSMSTAPSHPPQPAALAKLHRLYERADDLPVAAFLEQHPDAVTVLLEAAPHLRAAFGDSVVLRLELPRFDEEPLFARVYEHELAADAALERIERFDEAWWQAQPYEPVRRWVEFDVGWG